MAQKNSAFDGMTLDQVCEDRQQIEAHKVFLASSSPFFMELLKRIKHPHPLIYMSGLKSEDLLAMIDFLYRGEANICKENLESFFALAEELRMKGFLTGGGEAEQEQIKKTPKSK